MRLQTTILLFGLLYQLAAQSSDSTQLVIKAYVDAYYADFDHQISPNQFQPYTTVAPRDQRFGLNVAQIGLHYTGQHIRANTTLHYGDIANATWSPAFPAVQEANVGIKLLDQLWLDAGFFRTHIGTESFLPKNNYLSSTAVATYNEPFYQAGARLQYQPASQWTAELWVVNGYNFFRDINEAKSIGLLLNYQVSEQTSITYTNLYGRESLDGILQPAQRRFYQNLYLNTSLVDKLLLTIGGDFGLQSNSKLTDPNATAWMYTLLSTLRYTFSDEWSVTTRYERFNDPNGFISGILMDGLNMPKGLQLNGITLGGEYRPAANAYLRGEVRYLQTDELALFINPRNQSRARWEGMITAGVYLEKSVR